jgi:hypothetical protein
MHERIWAEHANNDAYYDYTSVGKALYGKSDGDAQLCEDEISSDWICLAEGFDGGDLRFDSCGIPPYKLQDHILMHAAILDPKVIVGMIYQHENDYFVGARYVALKDGAICSCEERLETYDYRVVHEYELDEVAEELKADESDDTLITRDEYWELKQLQSKVALRDLKDLLIRHA